MSVMAALIAALQQVTYFLGFGASVLIDALFLLDFIHKGIRGSGFIAFIRPFSVLLVILLVYKVCLWSI